MKKKRRDDYELNMPPESRALLDDLWARDDWSWHGFALWLKANLHEVDIEELNVALLTHGLRVDFSDD